MSTDDASTSRSSAMFGLAGLVMALCCVAVPAALGAVVGAAVVGAAVGNALGVAAAVAVALAAVLVVRRLRAGSDDC